MRMIFEALARHAAERPTATAFSRGDDMIGWRQLAQRVARAATGFAAGPQTVALALDGFDYVVGDLAATLAGRRVVPVPPFFSVGQIEHLVRQSGATLVSALPWAASEMPLSYGGGGQRVIYTSGTSGEPKGVVLGDRQIAASVTGLAAAIRPSAADRYLSALPQAQLLEQVCGMFLPVLAGAEVVLCPEGVAALFGGGSGAAFARAAEVAEPTVTVLAPRQLALWITTLRAGAARTPTGLRHVAVGGAPVALALLTEARAFGIPACPGYGLSEACSVVALSQPGDPVDGSVGRPIDGVEVSIEDGEVLISGPTVMQGYLGGATAGSTWRTGDIGRIEEGRLWIEGRRDTMIVRSNGRNLAPEWVEAAALADPAVIAAALVPAGDGLVLLLAPDATADIAGLRRRLETLPGYARPEHLVFADSRLQGLIRTSGSVDRGVAARHVEAAQSQWRPLAYASPDERLRA